MAATLKRNVVTKSEVFSAGTHKIYDEWRKVPSGLNTSCHWLTSGHSSLGAMSSACGWPCSLVSRAG